MPEQGFDYHGEFLPYFYHLYNLTHLNERMVEIAIAHWWIETQIPSRYAHHGLEVGNVLGHYRPRRHNVIDLYEKAAWYQRSRQTVINADILNLQFPPDSEGAYPWVCSISTIEHTGDGSTALRLLGELVQPRGKMLVTFPTGVDNGLDRWVADGLPNFTRACTISRCGDDQWLQDEIPTISEYGPWANAVAVCEWTAPA